LTLSVTETIVRQWDGLRSQFVDLIFPPRCVGCGQMGVWLCAACLEQARRVRPPFCTRCGDAVVSEGLCARCRTAPLHIDCIRSLFYFEGVIRDALHHFKYRGLTALAPSLGGLMAVYWMEHPLPADVIVPVPLHTARLRDRGYNQAALLAREMARRVGTGPSPPEVDERSLVRRRATAPQVELDMEQRKENVRDAFRCSNEALAGKHVLLIDDVCTTGATLEACAAALYEGGAESVRALTLARARHGTLPSQA